MRSADCATSLSSIAVTAVQWYMMLRKLGGQRTAKQPQHSDPAIIIRNQHPHLLPHYGPAPIRWGHEAMIAVVCPSVCLSVTYLTLSREWKGVAN